MTDVDALTLQLVSWLEQDATVNRVPFHRKEALAAAIPRAVEAVEAYIQGRDG